MPLGRGVVPLRFIRMEPITLFDAAHILGLPPEKSRRVLQAHGYVGPRSSRVKASVTQLEQLAMDTYPWHTHAHNNDSYWLTSRQAAEVLDLSSARVRQLLDEDRLPHLVHRSGARLLRRSQLEIIANARLSRQLQD